MGDTLSADLTFYENGSVPVEWDRIATFRGVTEGNVTRYAIPKPEPLASELNAFVDHVLGRGDDVVPLRAGLAAVRVAEAIKCSAATGKTIEVNA